MPQQTIEQRARAVRTDRMNMQPGRLVDDEQLGVLVMDREPQILGDEHDRGDRRGIDGDLVLGAYEVVDATGAAGDPERTGFDQITDLTDGNHHQVGLRVVDEPRRGHLAIRAWISRRFGA